MSKYPNIEYIQQIDPETHVVKVQFEGELGFSIQKIKQQKKADVIDNTLPKLHMPSKDITDKMKSAGIDVEKLVERFNA